MFSTTLPELDALAWRIADHGVATVEDDLAGVVTTFRRLGLSPTLSELLADRTAPEIARARAFGELAAAAASKARHAPTPALHAA
ncbi:MAG TPA: hypothetical protein VMS14_00340 [Ilumatobacteraceae bacterium]|nr:hypothetical protein [Ilumatobacteraceae bacterium]